MFFDTDFSEEKILYILIYYTIGAILGFFSVRFSYRKSKLENALNCVITTGLGVFLGFTLACFLDEKHYFSQRICVLLGGLASFGLPDIAIKYYPVLEAKLVKLLMFKIDNKLPSKDTSNEPKSK